ncbi:MAG TPA: hypothetical protein VK474_10935 [Chthoniobacterales bacterium]|nr:hypothetical protein [Chthoniobacterales bacterium]
MMKVAHVASACELDDLRRFAVTRSLFPPTNLRQALARMRFVQADPIRVGQVRRI